MMSDGLANFLAGVEATFGAFAATDEERKDFIASARQFYADYTSPHAQQSTSSDNARVPFWRYLLRYTTIALDRAASSGTEPPQERRRGSSRRTARDINDQQPLDESIVGLADEIALFWPSLAVLAGRQYGGAEVSLGEASQIADRHPPHSRVDETVGSSRTDAGTQTEYNDKLPPPVRPSSQRRVSTPPLVPPVTYSYARPQASTTSSSSSSSVTPTLVTERRPTSPYFPAAGPSSQQDDATSAASRRSLSTSTDTSASTIDEAVTPPVIGNMDELKSPLVIDEQQETAGSTEDRLASKTPVTKLQINPLPPAQPTLILADRGDNAAKLLPLDDRGSAYVLQVSIGGRKLLVNPERPHEVAYHDVDGSVVTRSLLRSVPNTTKMRLSSDDRQERSPVTFRRT